MRKRFNFDKKYRNFFFKNEFASRLLKYVSCSGALLHAQDAGLVNELEFTADWKNKSFKRFNTSTEFKRCSRIRNFCIVSGRGRGLSKNYFSVSRNAFKYLQTVGLVPGTYKSS